MNIGKWLTKHAPTILTWLGAASFVCTVSLVAIAAPEAEQACEEARAEKQKDELTTAEAIKAAAPVYLPAVAAGVTTLMCMFGANGPFGWIRQSALEIFSADFGDFGSGFNKFANALNGVDDASYGDLPKKADTALAIAKALSAFTKEYVAPPDMVVISRTGIFKWTAESTTQVFNKDMASINQLYQQSTTLSTHAICVSYSFNKKEASAWRIN